MQNVDALTVEKLFKDNKLCNLEVYYERNICPEGQSSTAKFAFKLDSFFEAINSKVTFSEISSICLFGSVLYRHIPIPTVVVDRIVKKRGTISIVKTKEERERPLPNDIDIFVLLKHKLSEGEPDAIQTIPLCERKIYKKISGYGGSYLEKISGDSDLPLHISFRSISQFLNGINHGDEISEYVATFGIPFVGQKKFYQTLKHIKGNVRKDMHRIKWKVDKNDFCRIRCYNKWWKNHDLTNEKMKREARNIPSEESNKNRFELMDV